MTEQQVLIDEALQGGGVPEGLEIRTFIAEDFPAVQALSSSERWTTPVERPDETLAAWLNSWPALVAVDGSGAVVGFLRALTDGVVTTYICEILVAPARRDQGLGSLLMEVCRRLHPGSRLDLLSTESADSFYRAIGCHEFRGFRQSDVSPCEWTPRSAELDFRQEVLS
jgi:ribosomal protein S18 acetylase RimI-like enzyme